MNLYFRMIWTIIAALFAKPESVTDKLTVWFRVWPNDLDTNFHMNNGRYMTLMDLGRTDLIVRSRMHKVMLKRKWYPVVGASHIVFRRSLNLFERFSMTSELIGWDDRWVYLRQDVFTAKGELSARAIFKTAFLHKGKRIDTGELAEAFGMDRVSPPLGSEVTDSFPNIL